MLPDLAGMILRFRCGSVAVISDVEKAFLQVRLQETEKDATRFIWVVNPHKKVEGDNIRVFRYARVPFGINASPFLLSQTIQYHLSKDSNPKTSKEIQDNTYVDNVIHTANSELEAQAFYPYAKTLFQEINMNLREFLSNNQAVMKSIPEVDRSKQTDDIKVLGIHWNPKSDILEMQTNVATTENEILTKRVVLRKFASIYDPMGFLCPLLLKVKIFIRKLWAEDQDWDVPLRPDLTKEWHSLAKLDGFQKTIPRNVTNQSTIGRIIICADASVEAISACVYLTTGVRSHLVMAKSKLTPSKIKPTIPKLETSALALGMGLGKFVIQNLQSKVNVIQTVVLSDSTITENRQANAEDLGCEVLFGYIASEQNPADCATRGLTKDELRRHFWWSGPVFSTFALNQWPKSSNLFKIPKDQTECILSKTETLLITYSEEEILDPTRYSRVPKLRPFVLRIINNLLNKVNKEWKLENGRTLGTNPLRGPLQAEEIEQANQIILFRHQRSINRNDSSYTNLVIFEDKHKLLRCRGRLGNTELPSQTKFPLLIEKKTALAKLLVLEAHEAFHKSISGTMAAIREKYWINQLRTTVKSCVSKCVACQRFNKRPFKYPDMQDLPEGRVVETHPFAHCGLDYFGPLKISNIYRSNVTEEKAYGAIFTCCTTRLIHLELVSSNNTIQFLNALRRFFGRRGVPLSITCDNQPAFNLGEKMLQEITDPISSDPDVTNFMANHEIVWKKITPYSPWQGGFYERLIKSVKDALYKTIRTKALSFEDLTTVLVEIEGVLNSRPLTYIEEQWDTKPILRPIDFIQNGIIVGFPTENHTDLEDDYVSPMDEVQLRTRNQTWAALKFTIHQTKKFWEIWRNYYLTDLRQFHKKRMDKSRTVQQAAVGQIVLLTEELQPRHKWKLGRIISLRKSKDGQIREARVKLANYGPEVLRPLNQLIPLEITDEEPMETEDKSTNGNAAPEPSNDQNPPTTTNQTFQRTYNLRKRKPEQTKDYQPDTVYQPQAFTSIDCVNGGIRVTNYNVSKFELCAENYCVERSNPEEHETFWIPPEISSQPYKVILKTEVEGKAIISQTSCEGSPFCENIKCIFCRTMIFNPECWPITAIIVSALLVYTSIVTAYLIWKCARKCGRNGFKGADAARNDAQRSRFRTTSKQSQGTPKREFNLKNDASAGSCQHHKCGAVKPWSKLDELPEANKHLGTTRCVPSCGSVACNCFFVTTGCLFYRIYEEPRDEKIYTIFNCPTWKHEIEVELTRTTTKTPETLKSTILLEPNKPFVIANITIVLSNLAVPYIQPLLNHFIQDGETTAMLEKEIMPNVKCKNEEDAKKLDCTVEDDCKCNPTDYHMRCECPQVDLRKQMEDIHTRLPVIYPFIQFDVVNTSIQAETKSVLSSELILTVKDEFIRSTTNVNDETCSVATSSVSGCYGCSTGSSFNVTCKSSRTNITGLLVCGEWTEAIKCTPQGKSTTVRRHFEEAEVLIACRIQCGNKAVDFQIQGTLNFAQLDVEPLRRLLASKPGEIMDSMWPQIWPDLRHIWLVWMSQSRIIIAVALVVILLLFITYTHADKLLQLVSRVSGASIELLARVLAGSLKFAISTMWVRIAKGCREAKTGVKEARRRLRRKTNARQRQQ
ncbi:hypothetical protein L596_000963 [Steinernema carpocapsae]|uniref:Integrase catalytic domain-containing protein n=1 Tax=Steinernema carpocapsae TaxID=34508 RepID=A0A4U8UK78_STECR|nr:hypothetical protein L596_000963 [Steinernema carpocapsae]